MIVEDMGDIRSGVQIGHQSINGVTKSRDSTHTHTDTHAHTYTDNCNASRTCQGSVIYRPKWEKKCVFLHIQIYI